MTPSEKRAAEQVVEALRHTTEQICLLGECYQFTEGDEEVNATIAAMGHAALAAWDAESGGERPGNGVEGLREPSPSALTHGVSGRSPALPADPAALPPATSPASDVHAGGGAPADPLCARPGCGHRQRFHTCWGACHVERYVADDDPLASTGCAVSCHEFVEPGVAIPQADECAPASEELLEQPTGLLDDLAKQMGLETPAERKEEK